MSFQFYFLLIFNRVAIIHFGCLSVKIMGEMFISRLLSDINNWIFWSGLLWHKRIWYINCFVRLFVGHSSTDVNVIILRFRDFLLVFAYSLSFFIVMRTEHLLYNSLYLFVHSMIFLCFASYGCCHPCFMFI